MEIEAERLLFRRQFILGPQRPDGLVGWRDIEINSSLRLFVHPDLASVESRREDRMLVLLGHILDPYSPTRSNLQILDVLAQQVGCFDDLISAIDNYGGRWIIVYHDDHESRILHDACGLRQIYYINVAGSIWCGSQPSILRHVIKNVEEDPDALAVTRLPEYARQESAWFGEGTIYKGIRHLLPNHYLDLTDGIVHRYWPRSPVGHTSVDKDCLDTLSRYLSGFLESAANRFDLMLPVTAGWDSRVLLAASKRISSKVFYYVSTMNMLPRDHEDVAVPSRLLRKLGLPFTVIAPDPEEDPQYREAYFRNVTRARDLPKSGTIHHFFKHCQGKVNICGNGAEIARGRSENFYRRLLEASASGENVGITGTFWYGSRGRDEFKIGANGLATVAGYPGVRYVVDALEEWLAECAPVCSQCGLDISDIYYWEQHIGNWGSMYQAEQDIAIEELWPFNIRALIEKMLTVDAALRRPPKYELMKMLIEQMWAEVLSEPINPDGFHRPRRRSLASRLRTAVSKRLPPPVRFCYRMLRDRFKGRTAG